MQRSIGVLALMASLVAIGVPSVSEATPVTCRTGVGCLNGTDFFDWGQFGPTFTIVPNNSVATSNGGVTTTVSMENGTTWERIDQGNGWNGNFAAGDRALWTEGSAGGPVALLSFSTPLSGFGAQIQADFFGAFTAMVEAFDASNNLLGSFSEAGNSNGNADNSAIFIGLMNLSGIAKVRFSVTSAVLNPNDFAINRLDITPGGAAVPEPTTLVLLGSGIATMVARRRQSKRSRE